jgi:hypothetical protein
MLLRTNACPAEIVSKLAVLASFGSPADERLETEKVSRIKDLE